MYSLDSLRIVLKRPDTIVRGLERQWYTRLGTRQKNPKGTSIFDLDWDNLIILDACRYDIFSEEIDIEGNLSSRQTLASATYDYVPANFQGRDLTDTVCVSVNGWYRKSLPEIDAELHALIDVEQMDLPKEKYDNKFDIPRPKVVTEQAIETAAHYPEKRLILHHNQPHYPYLGEYGRSIFEKSTSSLMDAINARDEPTTQLEVRRAYRENLKLILEQVKTLLPHLEGKTVITADHGEMLGERHQILPLRNYGHPPGIYNSILTRVPWFVIETGNRKKIIKEPPEESAKIEATEVTERNLRALGYV